MRQLETEEITGLFFGSFNPIHNGHLAIAQYLLDNNYCEKLWFMVSPQNPWKENSALLHEQKRFEIVQKAIAEEDRMEVSDFEFTMPRPSYTYQTLQRLAEKYPQKQFALVIGGDNLRDFHLWKDYEKIWEKYPLLVYPRPGIDLSNAIVGNIHLLDAPLADVSSTEIRNKVMSGEDISSFVPRSVLSLIQEYY